MKPLSPTVIDRLRPRPAQPDPDWSTNTLRAILDQDTVLTPPTSPDRLLVPVDRAGDRAAVRTGGRERGPQGRPQLRTGLAVAAAAGLLVGGLGVGLHLGDGQPPGPVVVDPAAPPAGPDRVVQTDVGPMTAAQSDRVVGSCHDPGETVAVRQVHYARQTSDGSDAPARLVAVDEDTQGGYRSCFSPSYSATTSTMLSGYGPGVFGPGGDLTPSPQQPLRLIGSYQWDYTRQGSTLTDVHLGTAFAVASSIDRVQVRVQPADRTGAGDQGGTWFEGKVEGGFVYVPVYFAELADPGRTGPDLAVEARAYNRAGQQVAAAQDSDLDPDRHGDNFVWPH